MKVSRAPWGLGLVAVLAAACGDDGEAAGGGGAGGAASASSTSSTTSSSSTTAATTATSSSSASSASGSGSGSSGQGGDPSGAGGTGGESTGSTGGGGSGGEGSGGDGTGSTGGGGGEGGAGGAGTGGSGGGAEAFPDDCSTSDDCAGGICVELSVGFRACRYPIDEAEGCLGEDDACCTTDDCTGTDVCTTLPDVTYCGGAAPQEQNQCVSSEDVCDGLECAESASGCVPAGVFGYKQAQCATSSCTSQDTCNDEPGGRCIPLTNPCCGAVAFVCAYPSDGCRDQSDCLPETYCGVDFETGHATCLPGLPECPA